MAGLIEFIKDVPNRIANIPFNPLAYALINAGSQAGLNRHNQIGAAGSGFLQGLENAQQNRMMLQQFNQQQQLIPLMQAIQAARAQAAMTMAGQPYGKPTPGRGFIPKGSKLIKDPKTGGSYWQTPEGELIPDEFAMSQYQQSQTNPDIVGSITQARERQKGVKMVTPEGSEYYAPQKELNPAFSDLMNGLFQTESGMNPDAVNRESGAFGLGQALPSTAKRPGFGVEPMKNNSPSEQARFSTDYLTQLLGMYGGDVEKALSAYHRGFGNVDKYGVTDMDYVNSVINNAKGFAQKRKQKTLPAPPTAPILAESGIAYGPTYGQQAQFKGIEKEATTTGEARGKAVANLPSAIESADYMLSLLDQLETAPGMNYAIGPASIFNLKKIPGSKAADYSALLKQVQGRTFLEAYKSLRGGGQITEVEGRKGEQAISRMSEAQSIPEFKNALQELKTIVRRGKQRAMVEAGQAPIESIEQIPTPSGKFLGFE